MPSHTLFDHYCDAWPLGDEPDDESSPYEEFLIDIHALITYLSPNSMEDDELVIPDGESVLTVKSFRVQRDHLIHDNTTISNMLSEMNVPLDVQPFMVQRILACACSMASATHNIGRKILPMVVSIEVVTFPTHEHDEDHAMSLASTESMDTQVHEVVPATKASIEALEKVKVEGPVLNQCMICLEDLLIGSEATQMPCSHVYHGGCIVNWLEKSNFCPLCRFRMPC